MSGRRMQWDYVADDGVIVPRTFPTSRAYGWMAVAAIAFVIYASLVPFEMRALPFDSAVAEWRAAVLAPAEGAISRTNLLANALLFIPVGFGLAGACLVDRRWRPALAIACPAIVGVSLLTSITAEFLQIFTVDRVPSREDVAAQTVGCVLGLALWAATGQGLTEWLRGAVAARLEDRVLRALVAYAAAWALVNLAPFDLTLDLGELHGRFRAGLIALSPFATGTESAPRMAWDTAVAALSAMPIGVLALVAGMGRGARRSALAAWGWGTLAVGVIEGAQIFILSHAAETRDILFGSLGIAGGAWIGTRMVFLGAPMDAAFGRVALTRVRVLTALVGWCSVIVGYHWLPFAFVYDTQAIQDQLASMSLVPFASYQAGSHLNALNDVLVKLGLSLPLGMLAAFLPVGRRVPASVQITAFVIASVAFFGIVEAGQLLLPTRTPDPSDVLTGAAGAALGLALGRWLKHGTHWSQERS